MKKIFLSAIIIVILCSVVEAALFETGETQASPRVLYGKQSDGTLKAIKSNADGTIPINVPTGEELNLDGSVSIGEHLTVQGNTSLVGLVGIGSSVNNANFEADGTLVFNGTATTWDDLRVAASNAKLLGNSDPDWETLIGNIAQLAFASNVDQEVFFSVQIPHSWKLGTDIEPHVHWSPSDFAAGDVTWAFEYTIAEIGGDLSIANTLTVSDAVAGTPNRHQLADLGTIDMSSFTSSSDVSIMLICRLYRDVDNGDDYGADAFLHEFDIHHQIDTLGSRTENTK